jgi:hypothetical protein
VNADNTVDDDPDDAWDVTVLDRLKRIIKGPTEGGLKQY